MIRALFPERMTGTLLVLEGEGFHQHQAIKKIPGGGRLKFTEDMRTVIIERADGGQEVIDRDLFLRYTSAPSRRADRPRTIEEGD